MSIRAVRQGIADNLSAIPGLRAVPTVPDSPNPPIATVIPVSVAYDSDFGPDISEYQFTVALLVGRVDERSAQNALDDYCDATGDRSVKAAIEADPTLGGVAIDLRVTSMQNDGQTPVGEVIYLSAEWSVVVYA